MPVSCEVAIVGAGPVGLALACALDDAGFSTTLIERKARAVLANPPDDGREIALTHRAVTVLRRLGLWQRLDSADISCIRAARVFNGASAGWLGLEAPAAGTLGHLVPNAAIRKAAFDEALRRPRVILRDGATIERIAVGADEVEIGIGEDASLRVRLLVAADGRLSATRRQLGIGAEVRDFGRTVIVCRLAHESPGDGIAYECFGYGRTLAILPLNDGRVSAVVTIASDRADALLRMDPQDFADGVAHQFCMRFGRMRLLGQRFAYPLVAVYADRFVAHRCALAGDAAVGMHPVTAHGFNLGLYGVDALQRTLAQARDGGGDIGSLRALSRYQAGHRQATRPMYLATNALVGLFTDDRPPARLARAAVLGLAARLPPLRAAVVRGLDDPRVIARPFLRNAPRFRS
ncbi:MAG: 5-demethoxyubiquinol-8 5-hydroxylase UbiM [Nevskiaceae bacterium]|nr:MAG: 5-demethoxyubiquinol-8 5-hydroxylase UbiM [Nevskiaceae bacterium]